MLWLKIVGVLFLYGFVQNVIQEVFSRPAAERAKSDNRQAILGCLGALIIMSCILAVFAFWILWLTGNPI